MPEKINRADVLDVGCSLRMPLDPASNLVTRRLIRGRARTFLSAFGYQRSDAVQRGATSSKSFLRYAASKRKGPGELAGMPQILPAHN